MVSEGRLRRRIEEVEEEVAPRPRDPIRVKMWGIMDAPLPGEEKMKVGEVRRGIRLVSRGEDGFNEVEYV